MSRPSTSGPVMKMVLSSAPIASSGRTIVSSPDAAGSAASPGRLRMRVVAAVEVTPACLIALPLRLSTAATVVPVSSRMPAIRAKIATRWAPKGWSRVASSQYMDSPTTPPWSGTSPGRRSRPRPRAHPAMPAVPCPPRRRSSGRRPGRPPRRSERLDRRKCGPEDQDATGGEECQRDHVGDQADRVVQSVPESGAEASAVPNRSRGRRPGRCPVRHSRGRSGRGASG